MPLVIDLADDRLATLDETADALSSRGFDPTDPESLDHAAGCLRRLGNDKTFLGDILIEELARRHRTDVLESAYGPQVVMLVPPRGDFFIRANIWPSLDEHMVRASGSAAFAIGLPHDHNFNFLTLGYFGPGYWSDYYEYAFEEVDGWRGEPVPSLTFIERTRLEEGKIQLYRANLDVHAQLPADSLSVSLNIMHCHGAQSLFDQYRFDLEERTIVSALAPTPSQAMLKVAVGLGGAGALDLAEQFAQHHPSDRLRLVAWESLASIAGFDADDVWRRAELCGSQLVAQEAKARRLELVG